MPRVKVSKRRLALLGMDNPYSKDARYALYPFPKGSAGHRLFLMLQAGDPDYRGFRVGFNLHDYVAIERRNLVDGPWSRAEALEAVPHIMSRYKGWDVVVLGREVWSALCLPDEIQPLEHYNVGAGADRICFYYLPHPSDHNRWYHVPANKRAAEKFLTKLYRDSLR